MDKIESLKISEYKGLLEKWIVSIRTAQKVHYKNARCLKTISIWLGATVVILSSIAGASIFSSLNDNDLAFLRVTAGIISLLAGVLASLQAFLNPEKKSEQHLTVAKKLTTLKREVEEANKVISSEEELKVFIKKVRVDWKKIITEAPIVGERIFTKMKDKEKKKKVVDVK